MKKIQLLVGILSILLFTACQGNVEPAPQDETNGQNEEVKEGEQEQEPVKQPEEENKENPPQVALSDFFMKDGTVANFKGEGNEFAQYTAKTKWLNDRYVSIYEDNGGTVMLRTYRIDDDKIVVVLEEGESYDEYTPTDSELEQLKPLYTYLKLPLEKDETFDGWKVIDNAATIDTPLQPFHDVIVLEKRSDDGSINRKYFAKDFGEIKREFKMSEGDEEMTVTSTIEKVE
ncbi:hypothetical protein KHA95_19330 [Bacillus sp. FJAT-50079]|nr:hypothetical protein [Bacillus sp. FJAT-50079]MBS4210215.1 hypothetical protein [Bacillus sp. FJAT-50079]